VGGDPERLRVLFGDERKAVRSLARNAVGAGEPGDGLVAVDVVDEDGVVGFDDRRYTAAVLCPLGAVGDNGTVTGQHTDRVVDHTAVGCGFVFKLGTPTSLEYRNSNLGRYARQLSTQ
jgi:hypothetical protein